MKQISLQNIADALKVSKATVSYVLNGRGDEKRVSKETQERIKKFAKKHKYNANQLARSLSTGKSNMIGLIVPNISDTFFARIARRIEEKAEESGYNVIFSSTGENINREQKIIQSMLDRKVDGLIIASCQQNDEDMVRLKKAKFPFVLIDRHYPKIPTNYVGLDNMSGITKAVNQLINNGRKRIGFVSLNMELETLIERKIGYCQAMAANGLAVENNFMQYLNYEHRTADVKSVLSKMLQPPIGIDSVIFATHFLAAEAIRELKAMNVKIPEQLAIVSYGQKKDFDILEPPITAIKFPIDEIGDKAVDILLRNINNPEMTFESIYLKTVMIARKSCGNR